MSASYTSLVAWFLSLVADRGTDAADVPPDRPVPFSVIGLQQMYINDQWCLYVAVVPAKPITGKPRKGKVTKYYPRLSQYVEIILSHPALFF